MSDYSFRVAIRCHFQAFVGGRGRSVNASWHGRKRSFGTCCSTIFAGSVHPINPKATNVLGVHCYPDLLNVPGAIDLAVVIVPAAGILEVVDQAIARDVKAIVVISAGFKEVGGKGIELEKLQQKYGERGSRWSARTAWE